MSGIMGHQIGPALIKALDLPENTRSVELRFVANEIVTVTIEQHPTKDRVMSFVKLIERYKLVDRETIGFATPATVDETFNVYAVASKIRNRLPTLRAVARAWLTVLKLWIRRTWEKVKWTS